MLPSIHNRFPRSLELRLDVQQTVVLGDSLTAGWGTRLEVAGVQRNGDIRNEIVSRLARPMGHENTPTEAEGELCTAEGR